MSVVKTFVGTFVAKGAGAVMTFLVGIMVARALHPAGKGQVDVLVTMAALLLMLSYPSLEEPQLYLIGSKRRPPGVLFANGLVAGALFGLLACLIFEGVLHFFPSWLSYRQGSGQRLVDVGALFILVLAVPFVVLQRVLGGLLQGLRDMWSFNLVFLTQGLVLVLSILVLVLVAGLGIRGAIWAYGLSMAAAGLCAVILCARHPEVRKGPIKPDLPVLWRLVVDGLRLHGGVVAAFVILASDQLILNRFLGPGVVGLYALAVALTGQLRRLVVQPVKEVLGSRVPAMVGDQERLVSNLALTCRHMLLLILVPGLCLALLGYPLIVLVYGSGFAPSYLPLLLLLPGNLFWALAVLLSYWFLARNRLLTLTAMGVLVAVANVLLNVIFIPLFPEHGLVVAALSSTLCYGLHLGLFLGSICRGAEVSPRAFLLPRREDLGIYRETFRKIRARFGH